jgi:Gpi18-like mannosyltransferase
MRGLCAFGAALAVTIVAAYYLRDSPGFLARSDDGRVESADINQYIYWTRLVTLGGVQSAYSGAWPETYAVYGPITLYSWELLGNIYRASIDPDFDIQRALHSGWLFRGIKITALGWHLLTALGIYLLLRQAGRGQLSGAAAALYVANPAAVFDVAHWGQPDGAHSFFGVLAVGWLVAGHVLLGWAAVALAALAKPQAWAILPLLALATWRVGGARGLGKGLAVAAAAALVAVLPFILSGRLAELLAMPGTISAVFPVVTGDAHNVWWLALASRFANPLEVLDTTQLLGFLSYRRVAAVLVIAQLLFACWLYLTRRVELAEATGLSVLGWFLFTTQAHENHLFLVLPLLALACPQRPLLLIVFGVTSMTLFVNMGAHDQVLLEALHLDTQPVLVQTIRLANATVNLLCWLAWATFAAQRPAIAVGRAHTWWFRRHLPAAG